MPLSFRSTYCEQNEPSDVYICNLLVLYEEVLLMVLYFYLFSHLLDLKNEGGGLLIVLLRWRS